MHETSMVLCDAVIIFYGAASEHWVRMKLFDILKAPGWGRRRALPRRGRLGRRTGHAARRPATRPMKRSSSSDRGLRPGGPRAVPRPARSGDAAGDDAPPPPTPIPDSGRSASPKRTCSSVAAPTSTSSSPSWRAPGSWPSWGPRPAGSRRSCYAGVLPALHGGFVARVGLALAHRPVPARREPDPQPRPRARRARRARRRRPRSARSAAAQVEATLRRSAFGLADAARQSAALGDGRLLVVVDQFEELFRFDGHGGRSGRRRRCRAVRAAAHRGDAGRARRRST